MEITDRIDEHLQNAEISKTLGASFSVYVNWLLNSLGYENQPNDDFLLNFCIQKVQEEIRNACNVREIPCGLHKTAVQLVVAEFLMTKKNMGNLNGLSLNFEAVVKQLQEGDTNIVWATDAGQSPEQRFDTFIAFLLSGRSQFVSYRRLKW